MFNYSIFNNQNVLLITTDKLKNKILKEIMANNTLMNIKLMSISELKEKLFFKPTKEAFTTIYYKYKKPLSIINKLIDYLYYIDLNIDYPNDKINELKEIKKYLLTNNLLKTNSNFIKLLKQYQIKFIGFPIIDKETNFLIDTMKKYQEVEILEYYKDTHTPSLVHLNTLEDEIIYVAESISNLLTNNVDINSIKLANINEEYYFYLKRIFKNYNIPLNINEKISLYSLPLTNTFLSLLKEKDFVTTIDYLKNIYPNYNDYINMYIDILNKYNHLDSLDLSLITYELKNTYLKNNLKNNSINIIDVDEVGCTDDYVFVMSTNYNYFPKIIKDEDYLLDIEKDLLNLSTSKDINNNNKLSILKIIKSSKNIYLSYKDLSYFNEYYKVDYLDINETTFNKNILTSYSKNEDKIKLIKNLDHNIKDINTLILNNNYNLNYQNYDSSFKGLSKDTLNLSKFINDIKISYSNLSTYYECPFKFYINNVLNLNEFEGSIYTIIGKVMHDVVESCFKPDFDFIEAFNQAKERHLKDYEGLDSELFFLDNVKDRTLDVVNYLKSHEEFTLLNTHEYEQRVEFEKEYNSHYVTIKGFIDKIISTVIDDITYCAIIDFKTGSDKIEKEKFIYGLNLQLPFYVYLLRNDKKYHNHEILGLYIHNILNKVNDDSTLKYNGLTLNDFEKIKILDTTYQDSKLIKNLKIYSNGSVNKYAKLISKEEIDSYYQIVEEKIKELVDNIFDCNFKINPKIINNKDDVSCKYCKYAAICYKKDKDYTYLTIKKDGDE